MRYLITVRLNGSPVGFDDVLVEAASAEEAKALLLQDVSEAVGVPQGALRVTWKDGAVLQEIVIG